MAKVESFTESEKGLEVKRTPSDGDNLGSRFCFPVGFVVLRGSWVLRQRLVELCNQEIHQDTGCHFRKQQRKDRDLHSF